MLKNYTSTEELFKTIDNLSTGLRVTEMQAFKGHKFSIYQVILSKDGNILYSCSDDDTIKSWDTNNNKNIHTFRGHENAVYKILLSSDEKTLYSSSKDGSVRSWKARYALTNSDRKFITEKQFDSDKCEVYRTHEGKVYDMVLSEMTDSLFSCGNDGLIIQQDLKVKRNFYKFEGHNGLIFQIILNQEETVLFSCGSDKTIRSWDIKNKTQIMLYKGHLSFIQRILINSSGDILYSCSKDKTIRQWDIQSGKQMYKYKGHTGIIFRIILSKKEDKLYSCSDDGTIKVWDVVKERLIGEFNGHKNSVFEILLSNDGKTLYSCSEDKTIIAWNEKTRGQIEVFNNHESKVYDIVLNPQENTLYSCSKDKTIRSWKIDDKELAIKLTGHTGKIKDIVLDYKKSIMYSGDSNGKIISWAVNGETDTKLTEYQGHTDSVYKLFLSNDGNTLFSCSFDGTLRFWDTLYVQGQKQKFCNGSFQIGHKKIQDVQFCDSTNTLYSCSKHKHINYYELNKQGSQGKFAKHEDSLVQILLSKYQDVIYSCSSDDTINAWDLKTKQLIHCYKGHDSRVVNMVLNSDESVLYSCGNDKKIISWNLLTKCKIHEFYGHTGVIYQVLLSQDDKTLFSCSDDGTIRLWDAINKEKLCQLVGHKSSVFKIQLSNDGKTLFSCSEDKTIRTWDVYTGQQIGLYRGHQFAVRNILLLEDETAIYSCSDDQYIRKFPLNLSYFSTLNHYFTFFSQASDKQFLKHLEIFHRNVLEFLNLDTDVFTFFLYLAIKNQYQTSVEYILNNNLFCNRLNQKMKTPLIYAIDERNQQVINTILKYYVQPENVYKLTNREFNALLKYNQWFIDEHLSKIPVVLEKCFNKSGYIQKLTFFRSITTYYTKSYQFFMSDFKEFLEDKVTKKMNLQASEIVTKEDLKKKKIKRNPTTLYQIPIDFDFDKFENLKLFLKKYIKSTNNNFLISPFQFIVLKKWDQAKEYYLIVASSFWLLIAFFCFYIHYSKTYLFVMIIILLSIIFGYELLSIFSSYTVYFQDKNNLQDLYIILHTLVTVCYIQFGEHQINPTALAILKIFDLLFLFIRGFMYLEVFDTFRHLINMIIAVTKSTFTVFVIIVYFMVALGVMITQTTIQGDFEQSLEFALKSIFGEMPDREEDADYGFATWFVLIITIFIVPIILLNFLIAKMSNKYSELEAMQTIISQQQQANLILEIEALKNFIKNKTQKFKELFYSKRRQDQPIGSIDTLSRMQSIKSQNIVQSEIEITDEKLNISINDSFKKQQNRIYKTQKRDKKYLLIVVPKDTQNQLTANLLNQEQKEKKRRKQVIQGIQQTLTNDEKTQEKLKRMWKDNIRLKQRLEIMEGNMSQVGQKVEQLVYISHSQKKIQYQLGDSKYQLYLKIYFLNQILFQFLHNFINFFKEFTLIKQLIQQSQKL